MTGQTMTAAEYEAALRASTTPEDEARALEDATARAGVPARFADVEPLGVPEAVMSGGGCYVVGPVGTGKTRTACGILRGWLASRPGWGARFVSSVALLTAIRSTYDGPGTEAGVIGEYSHAGLLVVDDLGKEVPSAWALSKLFELLDARWSNLRPTVVTTQLEPSALAAHLAERGDAETARAIVSRLVGGGTEVRTEGPDMRMSGGAR